MSKKYGPIDWDEIRSKKVELPKFKNAAERTAYLEELYKDADMMIDDEKILRYERHSIAMKSIHANPNYNVNHREVVKKGTRSDENRSKKQASMKLLMADPEMKAKQKVLKQSPDYIAKHRAGIEKRDNNPDYKVKQRIAVQKARENPEYQENNRKAVQKANGKPISCDGVVYPSKTAAAIALAPATMLRNDSKGNWLCRQMKKYPDRFFIINEE